jgi:ferredoxin
VRAGDNGPRNGDHPRLPSDRDRGGTTLDIQIDSTRCQGHARCNTLYPELFGLDEEGFAFVVGDADPSLDRAKLELAAANCPERAISFRGSSV